MQLDQLIVREEFIKNLKILLDPNNKEIPSNFELIYQSDLPQKVIVYKINHG